MTEKEKMESGYLFDANNDRELLDEIARCNDLCFEFNQIKPSDIEAQLPLLHQIFGEFGNRSIARAPLWVDYGYRTKVGENVFINRYCQIQDGGGVIFGDNVFVGPNCTFTTANHAMDAEQRALGYEIALPIVVGNNVWFATGCIVLPGVTIGDNSVVGAGSVVTKNVPANVLAAGVPCKVIRNITDDDRRKYPMYTENEPSSY